jgi:hypothetical protein
MIKIILLGLGISLLCPPISSALERFEIYTTTEMMQLLQDRENGKIDFLLVNALDEMIFRHASIPGSVNIPLGKFQKHAHKLGNDRDKLIIPY